MCGTTNEYSILSNRKYIDSSERHSYPELQSQTYEAVSPLNDDVDQEQEDEEDHYHYGDDDQNEDEKDGIITNPKFSMPCQPILLALVDTQCSEPSLGAIKASLSGAIETLPPCTRFGLVSMQGMDLVLHQPSSSYNRHVQINIESSSTEDLPTTIELQHALPLHQFLSSSGEQGEGGDDDSKAALLTMIEESLVHDDNTSTSTSTTVVRPLGEAVQAVLRYLAAGTAAAADAGTTTNAHVLIFLGGHPDCGRGTVMSSNKPSVALSTAHLHNTTTTTTTTNNKAMIDTTYPELTAWDTGDNDDEHTDMILGMKSNAFYQNAGAVAASLGVSIDILMVDSSHHHALLEPLALCTGGMILNYNDINIINNNDNDTDPLATMPLDVYKRVMQPRAFGCIMKLRTCPELEVVGLVTSSSSTPLSSVVTADPQYEGLYHIASCSPTDTFVFMLQHASRLHSTPFFQLVFRYLTVLPSKGIVVRRTRIITIGFPFTDQPVEVFRGCNVAGVTTMLLHQLVADGELGDRDVLGWLMSVVDCVAEECGLTESDPSMAAIAEMQLLPRAVFALLGWTERMLSEGDGVKMIKGEKVTSGETTKWDPPSHRHTPLPACLLSRLPPHELLIALYPQLSSWKVDNNGEVIFSMKHSLSEAAVKLADADMYLLDTFSNLILYNSNSNNSGGGVFPPPRTSLVRRHIDAARQERIPTPSLVLIKGSSSSSSSSSSDDDITIVRRYLIEDMDGFVDFLKALKVSSSVVYK
jgi:hypothetical protein